MPMSIDGVIRENNVKSMILPFFAKFKKHYCSHCGSKYHITWITQLIQRDSPEAEGKDLAFGPAWLFKKPIKYSFAIFECPSCGKRISIKDQYIIENPGAWVRSRDDYQQYLLFHNDKQ